MVETGGVGYLVKVGKRFHEMLKQRETADLCVFHHQKENESTLYGFMDWDGRSMFSLLLGVSGIGPKIALGVVDSRSPDVILEALLTKNTAFFSAFSGIGEKTAKKLVFELEGKAEKIVLTSPSRKTDAVSEGVRNQKEDLVSALVNLGYSRSVSFKTVNRHYSEKDAFDANFRNCLKILKDVE